MTKTQEKKVARALKTRVGKKLLSDAMMRSPRDGSIENYKSNPVWEDMYKDQNARTAERIKAGKVEPPISAWPTYKEAGDMEAFKNSERGRSFLKQYHEFWD